MTNFITGIQYRKFLFQKLFVTSTMKHSLFSKAVTNSGNYNSLNNYSWLPLIESVIRVPQHLHVFVNFSV